MQDGAAAHIVNYSTDVLNEVSENKYKLQTARSPDLNPL
jgi:hypothetical protein